jgi:hypothetical protein
MDGEPFVISTLVNKECYAHTLVDSGCLSYGLVSSRFVRKHDLKRIPIETRTMGGFDGDDRTEVRQVTKVQTNIGGQEEWAYFYIVDKLFDSYDLILGMPWFRRNSVRLYANKETVEVGPQRVTVRNEARTRQQAKDYRVVSAAVFCALARRSKGTTHAVFAASLRDIDKALSLKKEVDPRTKLPQHYHDFLLLFSKKESDKLPPPRGKGVDHSIELVRDEQGKEMTVPWGPLYSMSRDELLVLRKTLTELLDKGFIRVSNSPAAAPVLFVRKPGGGLRFCVDYRALNRISRKDRYPLPLIHETLRTIGQARWFTKLDVSAAFYKIRVQKGDEWKTAFRTRYGSYEWLVTPFGLANAPSTFQRYINTALKGYLDDFCSAYMDDVLIYSSGSQREHRNHVRRVLSRLEKAGLQLDISKCEFEVKETKYLGFILEAGKGIRMDPEKVKAVIGWQAPKSVKGVRSFLGFANFYRKFILQFSDIVRPISDLVKKDETFVWTPEADESFQRLKELFTSAPVLRTFDPDRTTIVETDSSGWCVGGTLLQEDDEGILRPCAYFSKKNSPAECNYEIYDKEMLAVVRCLEEWDAELRSVRQFQVKTDHKNLEYFMTVQKLTERQMRWSLILSRYNYVLSYVPGETNVRADALSRREQDMPSRTTDERLQYRHVRLLPPSKFRPIQVSTGFRQSKAETNSPAGQGKSTQANTVVCTISSQGTGQPADLMQLWNEVELHDDTYQRMAKAVRKEKRVFPSGLGIKVSIAECSLSSDGKLQFRGRRWVPDSEPLRTGLIQATHDSTIAGHPGREMTAALLMRQFFWPGMLTDVRRFVRNCDNCGGKQIWRERRQGFLKPLPVPLRMWSEISIDFIDKLPLSNGCTTLMVITDRLSKGVILEPCVRITAEYVAEMFVRCFYRHHGLPIAIVSDRGTQFTGDLWKRVCELLRIVRRLSTAFHPETDGSTERANQGVEGYIRSYVDYFQERWAFLTAPAELAINNHDASATSVSPFFMSHGYHVEPVVLDEELRTTEPRTPTEKGEAIVRKLAEVTEWAQASMATAQQTQEDQANRTRQQAPRFKKGDKVWLSLKNIRTKRPSKKLDVRNAKYTVLEVIGSHACRLDTPPGVHNVFNVRLLKLVATDPLPSQRTTDPQPQPEFVEGDLEYGIEEILADRVVQIGRGKRKDYLVKWAGYVEPTWEPASNLQETAALDVYEARTT